MEATLTSKGQLTIPKAVRDRMGLNQGDRVEFVEVRGKVVIRKLITDEDNPFLKQIGIAGTAPGTAVERQREMRGWDDWDRKHFG